MNNITREKEKLSYSEQTNLYVNAHSVCFVKINFELHSDLRSVDLDSGWVHIISPFRMHVLHTMSR